MTIQAGGKVIWTNRDSAPHTATAEDGTFDTGTIEEAKIKSETFKEPGTYAYICESTRPCTARWKSSKRDSPMSLAP